MIQPTNQKLFDFAYNTVLDEGGDGDCTIVFRMQDIKKVAEELTEFLKNESPVSWQRHDRDNSIVFFHSDESILITNIVPDYNTSKGYCCSQLIVTW